MVFSRSWFFSSKMKISILKSQSHTDKPVYTRSRNHSNLLIINLDPSRAVTAEGAVMIAQDNFNKGWVLLTTQTNIAENIMVSSQPVFDSPCNITIQYLSVWRWSRWGIIRPFFIQDMFDSPHIQSIPSYFRLRCSHECRRLRHWRVEERTVDSSCKSRGKYRYYGTSPVSQVLLSKIVLMEQPMVTLCNCGWEGNRR